MAQRNVIEKPGRVLQHELNRGASIDALLQHQSIEKASPEHIVCGRHSCWPGTEIPPLAHPTAPKARPRCVAPRICPCARQHCHQRMENVPKTAMLICVAYQLGAKCRRIIGNVEQPYRSFPARTSCRDGPSTNRHQALIHSPMLLRKGQTRRRDYYRRVRAVTGARGCRPKAV